jgi:ABC-type protease/lipase transport system fused ATPase/permease subunit
MDFDLRHYLGLIVITAGAVVLGLSYLATYMIGREHGRRQQERSLLTSDTYDASQRIVAVESAMSSLTNSVERLRDAQRLLSAQQDHLSRKFASPEGRLAFRGRQVETNTPT